MNGGHINMNDAISEGMKRAINVTLDSHVLNGISNRASSSTGPARGEDQVIYTLQKMRSAMVKKMNECTNPLAKVALREVVRELKEEVDLRFSATCSLTGIEPGDIAGVRKRIEDSNPLLVSQPIVLHTDRAGSSAWWRDV